MNKPQIVLRINKANQFDTPERRVQLAKYITDVMSAGGWYNRSEGLPSETNVGDTFHYRVDPNNDWWLRFYKDNPAQFSLQHRYFNDVAVKALSTWIGYRYGSCKMFEIRQDGEIELSLQELEPVIKPIALDAIHAKIFTEAEIAKYVADINVQLEKSIREVAVGKDCAYHWICLDVTLPENIGAHIASLYTGWPEVRHTTSGCKVVDGIQKEGLSGFFFWLKPKSD